MTDLDRYGLFALAVVILLILFISVGDMEYGDEDTEYEAILPEGPPSNSAVVIVDDSPPSSAVRPAETRTGDFDFSEEPVPYPGQRSTDPVPEVKPARGAYVMHKVRGGESFSSIAKAYYGSSLQWRCISQANEWLRPEDLKAGQLIRVPKKPHGTSPDSLSQADPSKKTTSSVLSKHVVKEDETLAKISLRYYGTPRRWRDIFDANRKKLANPDTLRVGVCLTIPR
jgi:nucleoid-associated protein YgaU